MHNEALPFKTRYGFRTDGISFTFPVVASGSFFIFLCKFLSFLFSLCDAVSLVVFPTVRRLNLRVPLGSVFSFRRLNLPLLSARENIEQIQSPAAEICKRQGFSKNVFSVHTIRYII